MEHDRGQGFPMRPLLRGWRKCCPCCGAAPLYRAYLKPHERCAVCDTPLAAIRTDDIAPYFGILIIGHLIVPALLLVERIYHPAVWIHWSIWPPLTLVLMFLLLPRVKGSVLAVMWHLGITGNETQ